MEACGSAQYWAREFEQLGHTVKLISPQFVKPYVKGNKKNDSRDAEAICEAVSRLHLRFVPLKAREPRYPSDSPYAQSAPQGADRASQPNPGLVGRARDRHCPRDGFVAKFTGYTIY